MTQQITPKEEAHFRVLRIIEKDPQVTQRELARQLGVSLSKTNYLVNVLVDKGAIKIESFRQADIKLKKIAYFLTPEGIRVRLKLTRGYLARKRAEYEALKTEIRALEKDALTARKRSSRNEA